MPCQKPTFAGLGVAVGTNPLGVGVAVNFTPPDLGVGVEITTAAVVPPPPTEILDSAEKGPGAQPLLALTTK